MLTVQPRRGIEGIYDIRHFFALPMFLT